MHEPFIFEIIEHLPVSNGVAIDIGSHQGTIAIILSKKFEKVYAFEPSKYNIEKMHLRGNVSDNIFIIEKAISNHIGKVKLFLNKNEYMHTISLDMAKTYSEFDFIEVDTITIDEFCKNKKIEFIKCDIEGAEDFVFESATETLKNNKIDVVVEFHKNSNKQKIIKMFNDYGYRIIKNSTISNHILFSNKRM